MNTDHPDIYTYRGRTLDELVPRIREDLGDDAVIVARREARTGGFAGFFARREIEVDVARAVEPEPSSTQSELEMLGRPKLAPHDPDESPAARLFREQLEAAQSRSAAHDVVSDEFAGPRAAAGDVDVHDLFPPKADPGYGDIFTREKKEEEEKEKDWNAAGEADVIHLARREGWDPPAGASGSERYEEELDAVLAAPIRDEEDEASAVEVELAEGPVGARRITLPPTLTSVVASSGAGEAAALARKVAARMIDRGLDEELAHRVSAEAVTALLPFQPDADVRELVARALAQHLPVAPLRSGAATAAFVGSSGAGKTRCIARLAAAYSRSGQMPVTVVALKPRDGGEELTRLLAPYDVQLISADSGDAAAAELTSEDQGMVLIDTPAIVLRDTSGRAALLADLVALKPDEVHVALPATMSAEAARELLDVLAELDPAGITVTHCDETFQLGTMLGLSIERNLPISYVGQGQAVDGGLSPIAAESLAAELLC
jgi:flagellar biosynthesis GTPase FlhF